MDDFKKKVDEICDRMIENNNKLLLKIEEEIRRCDYEIAKIRQGNKSR
jgi:hypothetical protein